MTTARIRFLAVVVGIAALATIAGYSLWWRWMAGSMVDGVERWAELRNKSGWAVETGTVTTSGFPGAVRLTLPSPSLRDVSGNAWRGPPVVATVSPFSPGHAQLAAPGTHQVALAGLPAIEVTAGQVNADLAFDFASVERLSFDLDQLAAAGTTLTHVEGTLQRLATGSAPHTTPTWSGDLALDGLALANGPQLVLGRQVTSLRLKAQLLGSIGPGALAQALAAWRDDGGTVKIDTLAVEWPPLGLSGNGTLALDRDMQPMLASSCAIRGLFDAIDGLVRSGAVKTQDARVVKLVLGLMVKPGATGVPEVTVPVTVENRTLYVGPAALLKLPTLEW
jgi:hypothetical protein